MESTGDAAKLVNARTSTRHLWLERSQEETNQPTTFITGLGRVRPVSRVLSISLGLTRSLGARRTISDGRLLLWEI
jgi:hypothetical protein